MVQKQGRKQPKEQEKGDGSPPAANPEVTAKGKVTAKNAADLIDKIDEILGEHNAEEFVKNYVQRGGE